MKIHQILRNCTSRMSLLYGGLPKLEKWYATFPMCCISVVSQLCPMYDFHYYFNRSFANHMIFINRQSGHPRYVFIGMRGLFCNL